MEKLQVKKIDKKQNKDEQSLNFLNTKKDNLNVNKKAKKIKRDQNNKKNKGNFIKNKLSSFKTSKYFSVLNAYKIPITFVFILFLLTSVFCFVTFINNPYFIFLMRPKVLGNGELLSVTIFIFLSLLFINFVCGIFVKDNKNSSVTNEDKNIKIQEKSFLKENIKNTKKLKKIQKFDKNLLKKHNFKLIFLIFLEILFLILAFNLHFLWLCVFICFITFFTLFVLLYKSKKSQNKILSIILLLNFVCILLSFYFIYLLN